MSEKYTIDLSPLYDLGGKDFVAIIVGKMIKSLPESFTSIENSTQNQDWPALKSAAHKAKSTFAYLRLQDVKEQLADIEHCAGDQVNLDSIPDKVQKVIVEGKEILALLKEKMLDLI